MSEQRYGYDIKRLRSCTLVWVWYRTQGEPGTWVFSPVATRSDCFWYYKPEGQPFGAPSFIVWNERYGIKREVGGRPEGEGSEETRKEPPAYRSKDSTR